MTDGLVRLWAGLREKKCWVLSGKRKTLPPWPVLEGVLRSPAPLVSTESSVRQPAGRRVRSVRERDAVWCECADGSPARSRVKFEFARMNAIMFGRAGGHQIFEAVVAAFGNRPYVIQSGCESG